MYEFLCPVTGLGLYVPDHLNHRQQYKKNYANTASTSDASQCQDPIVFAASEQSLMSFVLGQKEKIKCKVGLRVLFLCFA
ncbi:unnamed protein product [Trichobilharzia regenti]|nr:unnamed protein product [Trichobilharzia regenti]